MIPANAVLKNNVVAHEIYRDRVSYLNVIIISNDGAGNVVAQYYNPVSGLFVPYTVYDNHLLSYDSNPAI